MYGGLFSGRADRIGAAGSIALRPHCVRPIYAFPRRKIRCWNASLNLLVRRSKSRSTERPQKNRHAWRLIFWSGRQDLNLRPLHPQRSALPDCATARLRKGEIKARGFAGVKPLWLHTDIDFHERLACIAYRFCSSVSDGFGTIAIIDHRLRVDVVGVARPIVQVVGGFRRVS